MDIETKLNFELDDDAIVTTVLEHPDFERAVDQQIENALERQEEPNIDDKVVAIVERELADQDRVTELLTNQDFIKEIARQVVRMLTANVTLELGVEGDAPEQE